MLATEFYWREPPTDEAREVFLGQVCRGMHFDSVEDWMRIYLLGSHATPRGLRTVSKGWQQG